MTSTTSIQRSRLVIAGVVLTLLLAAVFTLGSLDTPFQWRNVVTLFAISSFITAALLVFLLIVFRSVFRLLAERGREQLGARFKTKMVVGAVALSLLPIVFMFFMSYSLLNRTLARWFPRPIEIAAEQSQHNSTRLAAAEKQRLAKAAADWAAALSRKPQQQKDADVVGACDSADAFWILSASGRPDRFRYCWHDFKDTAANSYDASGEQPPHYVETLPSGAEMWSGEGQSLLSAKADLPDGRFALAGRIVDSDFLDRIHEIRTQTAAYDQEKQHLRALKRQLLLILSFFTVLLLSSVLWLALYLSKQVTVPIQALAEGTREISAGNFDYQVPEQTHDELGALVRSFNSMTTQLRDSRSQIDQFTRNLQQAVQELERRRQLMETVLENIPTGVLSLDAQGNILRVNPAMAELFGEAAKNAHSVEEIFGPDDARAIRYLFRRALRTGVVSRELEIIASGRVLHAAVTVSALGPRRANSGFVLVLDDLTELLRAQKAAAWQEVARRIAHEIKNPLTPIQLSAQRLSRFLEKRVENNSSASAAPQADPELTRLVEESSRLIEREVGTLAALVNEFSQFVRFPSAKLESADVNQIVEEAVEVFSNRLEGVTLDKSLAPRPPAIRADSGLLRSVIVNLIDNAAEAIESSPAKKITVETRAKSDHDSVEIVVTDTGHGISPQDKDKLFLPHFSTKDRGTGLGLAIAARIIAEHGGEIRVEDNFPIGSRFILELPAAEVPASAPSDRPI